MKAFFARHRVLGALCAAAIMYALQEICGGRDGYTLAIGPAVIAGIAAGGAILKGLAGRKKDPRFYKPNVNYLRDYEGKEHTDIASLYGPDAFSGPGLGLTPEQLAGRQSEHSQESQAEYQSDVGQFERAAATGGLRRSSGAFYRGKQRALQSHLGRMSDIRRRNLIYDAYLRRQDKYSRIGATGRAYRSGVDIYNAYRQGRAGGQKGLNVLAQAVGEGAQGFAGAYPVG